MLFLGLVALYQLNETRLLYTRNIPFLYRFLFGLWQFLKRLALTKCLGFGSREV